MCANEPSLHTQTKKVMPEPDDSKLAPDLCVANRRQMPAEIYSVLISQFGKLGVFILISWSPAASYLSHCIPHNRQISSSRS